MALVPTLWQYLQEGAAEPAAPTGSQEEGGITATTVAAAGGGAARTAGRVAPPPPPAPSAPPPARYSGPTASRSNFVDMSYDEYLDYFEKARAHTSTPCFELCTILTCAAYMRLRLSRA